MIKLVVFDLDNVIIDGEGIDEIGKLINIEDQIAAITEQAMQGDIDFETSIKKRVGLLKGVATDDIRTLANEMPLMKGAKETVSTLKENGFEVAIISGSFDIIADTIKGKLDVDNIFTNSLVEEDGVLTGEVTGPLVSGSKLDVLSKLIEEKGYTLDECVAVGDGANDISMIESAKYGIAFNAKPALKENADIIVETRDLTDVLNVIINLNSENTEGDADVDKEVAVETEVVETTDVVVENQEEQVADATEEVVEEIEETEEVVEEAEEEVAEEETAEEEAEDVEEEAVEEEVAEDEEEAEEEAAEEEAPEAEEEVAEEKPVKEAKPKKSKKKNALPEPDFDLADTIEGVRVQKDEREERIAKVADEREAFNREAKEQRKIRDELNSELKENLAKAIEFRDQRNEINKQVEENKNARNKVNDEIKSLEWSSGKKDKIRIEAEIKKIDKIIETRVLDIKKENQLVKNANDLRKELAEIKEDDKVKEEAAELKKKSEEYHAKVVELSEQAQEAHEQMLSYFRKTDEIRTAADEAHKLFIQARKNASAKHEEFKMILSEIHVINKKLGSNKNRKRRSDKSGGSSNNKKNREEKERAESIFDKFKNGKKLSTEELLLLQKYDIN
ncbi:MULTISPECIES: phosphoserine phosphatase SerB [Methanobrevibacter]|uniref:phosphoserine phosphatase SerB n=3 Tax=Methanobacteriaceae TaxID=2159 RepID=UPI0026EBA377|nr:MULTISPECIES: phosphoserine phosphatase SerB [Methanobrevibacter]MCI5736482.1 phosphoserine phosphatase SerB [Methanobrevibacter ruminantium]